jgi:filamentous hemagglutinin
VKSLRTGSAIDHLARIRLQRERAAKKIAACTDDACLFNTTKKYYELSLKQDIEAITNCAANPTTCAGPSKEVANTMADLNSIKELVGDSTKAKDAPQSLINSNYEFQEILASSTTEHSLDAKVESLRAKWNLSDAQANGISSELKVALAVGLGTAGGLLAYKRAVAKASVAPSPAMSSGGQQGGAKATATPRTPLADPTEKWKTFVNAEKQIQLEAGAGQRVDQVINETLSGKKNFTSDMTLTTDEALSAGQKDLGPEYREIGKPGSGGFHSADGTKEFHIDSGSISGAHAPGVPHVHFGAKDPVTGKIYF